MSWHARPSGYHRSMRDRQIDPATHHVYPSLGAFLRESSYPAGTLTIQQFGLPIDILHDPRGYDATTVFFHPAISPTKAKFPIFTGRGISEKLPTDRIFVSDPTLYMNDRLRLAWFAGNHRQYLLQRVIANILRALIKKGNRVVTFGPSGGGFAALYYATRLPRATAVPVNPQTDIAKYVAASVSSYAEKAWKVDGPAPANRIPAVTNLVELYSQPVHNRVWYVQNTGDSLHMKSHFQPFMDSLHSKNRVEPILIAGGAGHVPPPKNDTRMILSAAVRGHSRPPAIGGVQP